MSDILRKNNDFYIDRLTGDFKLASGDEETSQRIIERLRSFAGEFFLDDEGLPYFQEILGKGVNLRAAYALILDTILQTPGVASVEEFEVLIDPETRQLVVNARLTGSFGSELTLEEVVTQRAIDDKIRDLVDDTIEDLTGDIIEDLA